MNIKAFENSFESWYETFFMLTQAVTLHINQDYDNKDIVYETGNMYGTMGICELMVKWTNEFEELNKGRNWDGEWMDEVDKFFRKKLEK